MKHFLFLTVSLISLQSFAVQLFIWQPSEAGVAVVMGRADNETPKQAAQRYLDGYNKEEKLVALNGKKLELPLEGFKDITFDQVNPNFLVIVSEPTQIRGGRKGKPWHVGLARYGANVFVLPNNSDIGMSSKLANEFRALLAKSFDGILVLGGEDIDPSVYGEKNRHANAREMIKVRDISEKKVLEAFFEGQTAACFGICRGAQLSAVTLGYKLIQDIERETSNTQDHVFKAHDIVLLKAKGSVIRKEFGTDKIGVNSWHHQAVDMSSNKNGPLVLVAQHQAEGEDSISEAMEFKDRPGFLLQFHPERMKNNVGYRFMRLMVDIAKKTKLDNKGRKCAINLY